MIREVTYSNPITTLPTEIKVTHELNKLSEQEWTIKIDNNKKNLWETVKLLITATPKVIKIIYYFLILMGKPMDWKTTLFSLLSGVCLLLADMLPEYKTIFTAISGLLLALMGYFAKDKLKKE